MSGQLAAPRSVVKFARLAVNMHAGDGVFLPWASPVPYRAQERAVCGHGRRHAVPHAGCSCGFYATETAHDLLDLLYPTVRVLAGAALLDVEFGGVELAGPLGVRAAEQRVLGAALLRWCPLCPLSGDAPATATTLLTTPAPGHERLHDVEALCDDHAATHGNGSKALSLADAAGLLRTDVTWADARLHARILHHIEQRWSRGERSGPLAGSRRVRELRMGQIGFPPISALRLDQAAGTLWIALDAPAPQRPLDDTVGLQRSIGLDLELLVRADQAAELDERLTRPRPPILGRKEALITGVRGLARMPQLRRALGA